MTPLFRHISIAAICAALAMSPLGLEAQHRSGRGNGHSSSQSAPSRAGNSNANKSGNHRGAGNRTENGGKHNNNAAGRAPSAPQYGNFRPSGSNNGEATRPSNGNNNRPTTNPATRPNNGNHNQGLRPGTNNSRPGNSVNNNRPGQGSHNPGTGPEQPSRPNKPTATRPQPGNGRPQQPSHNMRPPTPAGPGMGPNMPNRPGNIHRPTPPGNHWGAPPLRPYRPVARPWHRPVPPSSWRPRPTAPVLSTILGITFGTALNISINALVNSGYQVDGYANNTVYLRDVNTYNYLWPDATLYYGSTGGLNRSEFIYSTNYPDPMRYNSLYGNFTGIYGAPVSYTNNGTSLSATWFAPNKGYITLQYAPQYAVGGQLRYFTTLTLGL